jgi:endoglucanase
MHSLKRGLNLAHLFTWPPLTAADPVAYAWPPFEGAPHQITDAELGRITAAGFDFVRLPVDPAIFLAETAPDRRAVLYDRLRDHVRRIQARGLGLLVDLHSSPQNPAFSPEAMAGAGPQGERHLAAYAALVADLAGVLAAFPEVALEPINEPAVTDAGEAGDWAGRMQTLYATARAAAPDMTLVISGADYDHARDLVRLDPKPYAGQNAAFTFHSYEPFTFTHQGAAADLKHVAALPWPACAGSMDETLAACRAKLDAEALAPAARERAWSVLHDQVHTYFFQDWGPAQIDREFDAVAVWAKAAGIAPDRVLLGEFGAGGAPAADRARWLRAMREAAGQRGFGWALWAYAAADFSLAGPDGRFDDATLEALGLTRT